MHRALIATALSAGTLLAAAAASAGPASPYTPPASRADQYRLACTLGPSGFATIRNTGRLPLRHWQSIYVVFRDKSGAETRPQQVQVHNLLVDGTVRVSIGVKKPETLTSCRASKKVSIPRLSL